MATLTPVQARALARLDELVAAINAIETSDLDGAEALRSERSYSTIG